MMNAPAKTLEQLSDDIAIASLCSAVSAYAFRVGAKNVVESARGCKSVALARQVAMYLCHVVAEMTIVRVGLAFGRDRSTAGFAAHKIEDMRDDADFDRLLEELETIVRSALPARVAA